MRFVFLQGTGVLRFIGVRLYSTTQHGIYTDNPPSARNHKPTMSDKIPGSAHLNLTVGGLTIVGGLIGYMKKGSQISLVAGLSMGSLLLTSGYMIAKTDYVYEAHLLAGATSGIMSIAMGHRFIETMKFMPAGIVATLGTAACAYNVMKAIEWAPSSASDPDKKGKALILSEHFMFVIVRRLTFFCTTFRSA
jgi:uncharacterized membrane protein (UPF0136 family)